MTRREQEYFDKGYADSEWGYPLLDHVWEEDIEPKRYQESYRAGQVKAYEDGKSPAPWFHKDYVRKI